MTINPLLQFEQLPAFEKIKLPHLKPALKKVLKENRITFKKLLTRKNFSWNSLIIPLEEMEAKVERVFGVISHLNSVQNSEKLRPIYNTCLREVSKYHLELAQNTQLFKAAKTLYYGLPEKQLDPIKEKVLRDLIRDLTLSGANLKGAKKKLFNSLAQETSRLSSQFSNHVLDATYGWNYQASAFEIKGIPERTLSFAKNKARAKKHGGWMFSLDYPTYASVITYADHQPLRKTIYTAFVTRASEEAENKKWDNTKIMQEILIKRKKLAQLLHYPNYAEYSLANKMASTPKEVLKFLNTLAEKTLPFAKKEWETIEEFALKEYKIKKLRPWDISYYSEKLKQKIAGFSEEELRPYFPAEYVLKGMLSIAEKIWGLKIKFKKNISVWHPEVMFLEIFDQKDNLRGQIYLDLYAREHKKGGAWMDIVKTRRKNVQGEIVTPCAYLITNFAPPLNKTPSLLSHQEVSTLFHEFGHCLQHLLSKIDYSSVSGINGIPLDAVEFVSQFMESWTWDKDALDLISCHYQTKEKIPDALFKKMIAAKNFQAALQMLRQIEFALFDFELHLKFDANIDGQVQKILDEVRAKIGVLPIAKFNRFQNSFTHIFGGGYAAGYYSYKWSEVLSADAFTRFQEKGTFNRAVGQEFLHAILETGGSEIPLKQFINFMGRAPKIDALLKQYGIVL
jgi:oligopeptidase A